jgi:hypothetical protein
VKPLSISNALKLYRLIGKYIPELSEADNGLEFVGKIIEDIKVSGNHRDYVEAVALMMGTTVESLVTELKMEEILTMFMEGLQDNKILFLQEFCKKVGFNG